MNGVQKAGENMKKDSHETNRPLLLMQSFWQLQKSVMGQIKQTAIDNDLSVPQFTIIVMIGGDNEIAQKSLQARTHFPKSTLSQSIEGLVQAGLLNRIPVEDNRREMNLALSDCGKALLKKIKTQEDGVHTRFNQAVDSFTEDQFNHLIDMHQHIATFFEGGGKET